MSASRPGPAPVSSPRVMSVDALRGFVMFTMIFVNDLAGAPETIVPSWMRHFHGKSGMTFVDLVFPAFLFLLGMSIPLALTSRVSRESLAKTMVHVVTRTLALLVIGILMVNESPDAAALGWSPALWSTLMYLSAIFAFCAIAPPAESEPALAKRLRGISLALRLSGMITLGFLAFAFRKTGGQRIITLNPFSIHTEWYGILGLIGWAYLVGSIVFLFFRQNRTALLGMTALLLCLYAAERTGAFNGFWLERYVGIGGTIGSQGSITVAGMLLASILLSADTSSVRGRVRFTILFILGFASAALLVHGLYGINKNSATPSWCLWACAITAALWLLFYFICDVRPMRAVAAPLARAGVNVLLAYLLSEMLPSLLDLVGLSGAYDRIGQAGLSFAVARSALCGLVILSLATALNKAGFKLRI